MKRRWTTTLASLFCLISVVGSELSISHRVARHVNAAKIRSARSVNPTVADVEKRDTATGGHYRSSKLGGAKFKPFFDVSIVDDKTGLGNRNVTTVEGGRATLACTVKNLGPNRTVSWIRKTRPPVVLSYGGMAFTSDRRVSIEGPSRLRPHSWLLNINPILAKDHGLYECQVNTRGKMSLVYKLNVAPAQAQLFGKPAVYVKEGSTISLTCAINLFSVPPPDITWMHGSKVLNFESPRGGISLETEKTRTGTTSKLLVTRARMSDSGGYTCNPSRGRPVTADVHIITGENPAGLQDGQTSVACQTSVAWWTLLTMAFCTLFRPTTV